jgi:hypothetical protein
VYYILWLGGGMWLNILPALWSSYLTAENDSLCSIGDIIMSKDKNINKRDKKKPGKTIKEKKQAKKEKKEKKGG